MEMSKEGFWHHVDNIAHQSVCMTRFRDDEEMVGVCQRSIEMSKEVLNKFFDERSLREDKQ